MGQHSVGGVVAIADAHEMVGHDAEILIGPLHGILRGRLVALPGHKRRITGGFQGLQIPQSAQRQVVVTTFGLGNELVKVYLIDVFLGNLFGCEPDILGTE